MAAVKAASPVHVAANDNCARSRAGQRAVAESARADVAQRLRTQTDKPEEPSGRCASERRYPTRETDHEPLTLRGRLSDALELLPDRREGLAGRRRLKSGTDSATEKEPDMNTYVIRRKHAWKSPEELQQVAARSKQVADDDFPQDIRWIRS
jgi:hypothetical protein